MLTDRDGFWAKARNLNSQALIIGFSGHTQSEGQGGTKGSIRNIAHRPNDPDPKERGRVGAYETGERIYTQHPGWR